MLQRRTGKNFRRTAIATRCPSQGASGALRGQCAVVAKVCPESEVAPVHEDGEN